MFLISHDIIPATYLKIEKKARQPLFLILIRKISDKETLTFAPFKLISKYLHFSHFFGM